MPRPIHAHISLSALEYNLQVVRRSTRSRILAVIKANAYGHGLLQASSALSQADGFGIVDISDALLLRDAGVRQPILLLEGCFSPEDMRAAAQYELASVIHAPQQIALLDAFPRRGALHVWLKLNTGMNRLGFAPHEVPAVLERLGNHAAVREVTLMTHFASADEAPGVAAQLSLFESVAAPYRMARSLANSAALMRYPETHGDWVRPGIMLYGASPFADFSARQIGLRPAMNLGSEVIAVRELKQGEQVGYGGLFRAESGMRVGTVACGYADGYPRHAQTGTPIAVAGQRTRTLGRISMDMLSVDLSNLPGAGVGSSVMLWGDGMPVEEVAHAAGTISYELLCGLTARVAVTAG